MFARNNFKIESFGLGLGSEACEVDLFLPFGETTSIATMIPVGESERIKVEVAPLDSLSLEDVSLMKIDCEGFEVEILKGGLETIRRSRPAILIEALTIEEYSRQEEFLTGLDFVDMFPDGIGKKFGDDRNHL